MSPDDRTPAEGATAAETAQPAEPVEPVEPVEPKTVLVVDDEVDTESLFRLWFRRELRSGKLRFHFALNGTDALGYLGQQDHDVVLILSDVNMPGMSGLELLQRIRDIPSNLPVFMITAYGRSTEEEAMSRGADGFLTKPLDFEVLRQRILS